MHTRASWLKYGGCSESFPTKTGQSPTATRRTWGTRDTPCPRVEVWRKPPGRFQIPLRSLSAGATLAVCQASRSNPVYQAPSTTRVASKRGQKNRPFNNHPEISTRLATAAQDPRKGAVRREPVEDYPSFVSTHSEQLSYLSKPARTRRFCAKRFFLLDRPRPVLFLSRTKREWGVDCSGHRRTPPRRRAAHPPFSYFRSIKTMP